MNEIDEANFEGHWTIFESGSGEWAGWFPVGSRFEIKRGDGKVRFEPVRHVHKKIKGGDVEFEDAPGEPEGGGPFPGRLVLHCPEFRRYILMRVRKKDHARIISLSFDDSGDHLDRDGDHSARQTNVLVSTAIKHGGPHGIDG